MELVPSKVSTHSFPVALYLHYNAICLPASSLSLRAEVIASLYWNPMASMMLAVTKFLKGSWCKHGKFCI